MAVETPQYVTLAAATPATVTFNADYDLVRVTNVDGVSAVYFTADGVTAPAVETIGNFVAPAAPGAHRTVASQPVIVDNPFPDAPTKTVKVQLISAGAAKVCVEGLSSQDLSFEG